MGDKCAIYGYQRCLDAMEFHHINPNEKEFQLAQSNARSWDRIAKELRKCVLLCSNCHREVHAGLAEIPANYVGFNEDFLAYKKSELSYCPCGSLKYNYNKFCSKACAAKSRKKIEWEKIDLVEMAKNKNLTQIGRELKVSDNTIRKRLEKQRGEKSV